MAFHRFGQYVREWHELEESGTPLEPLSYRIGVYPNGGLTIRQEPAPYESGIHELSCGRVAYVLPAFVRRDAPGRAILRDWSLHVPWDDSVEWLEVRKGPRGDYLFPGSSLKYPREIELNHRMRCVLARGDVREGFLLAVGRLRPPEPYPHGDIIPITLSLLDQWDCEPSAVFKLRLERCRTFGKEIKKSRRGPLLSRRDKIVPASLIAPPLKKESVKNDEWSRRMAEIMTRVPSRNT